MYDRYKLQAWIMHIYVTKRQRRKRTDRPSWIFPPLALEISCSL